jgi:hypothetical protein
LHGDRVRNKRVERTINILSQSLLLNFLEGISPMTVDFDVQSSSNKSCIQISLDLAIASELRALPECA